MELHVEFDIGIPLMAEMLDPIAERALRDFTRAGLDGLLGGVLHLDPAAG